MSHNVNLYVVQDSPEIQTLLDQVAHVKEGGYALIEAYSLVNHLSKTDNSINTEGDDLGHEILRKLASNGAVAVAHIETDYFGGSGTQCASSILHGIVEEACGTGPINQALHRIGVNRTSQLDEFDCINLGRYRSNDDVIKEWNSKAFNTFEWSNMYRRFILKSIPSEILSIQRSEQTRFYETRDKYYVTDGNVIAEVHEAHELKVEDSPYLEIKYKKTRLKPEAIAEIKPTDFPSFSYRYCETGCFNFFEFDHLIICEAEYGVMIPESLAKLVLLEVTEQIQSLSSILIDLPKKKKEPKVFCPECDSQMAKLSTGGYKCIACNYVWQ